MNYSCPLCENKLVTEDLYFYTCINCGELFTLDELTDDEREIKDTLNDDVLHE